MERYRKVDRKEDREDVKEEIKAEKDEEDEEDGIWFHTCTRTHTHIQTQSRLADYVLTPAFFQRTTELLRADSQTSSGTAGRAGERKEGEPNQEPRSRGEEKN